MRTQFAVQLGIICTTDQRGWEGGNTEIFHFLYMLGFGKKKNIYEEKVREN